MILLLGWVTGGQGDDFDSAEVKINCCTVTGVGKPVIPSGASPRISAP